MTNEAALAPRPGHKALRLSPDGKPRIEAFRCAACGAVVMDATPACRACGHRPAPEPVRIGERGRLWTWSVVHRSYPGVAVPFVSAIVDMQDGLALKGTLVCDPAADLRQGQPVRLVYDDAGGAKNAEGAPFVGFHFVLAGEGA